MQGLLGRGDLKDGTLHSLPISYLVFGAMNSTLFDVFLLFLRSSLPMQGLVEVLTRK
jgi:hypothetical protein